MVKVNGPRDKVRDTWILITTISRQSSNAWLVISKLGNKYNKKGDVAIQKKKPAFQNSGKTPTNFVSGSYNKMTTKHRIGEIRAKIWENV